MKKCSTLKSAILASVYPSGAKENLLVPVLTGQKSPMDMLFDEGFNEIQKWIEEEQAPNTNLIRFCNTNFKCGMSVVDRPPGNILRVYTVGDDNYCDPVFLKQVDWPTPEAEALRYRGTITSAATLKLPLGFLPADASTDAQCGRARSGVWALNKNNIFIWPWIQSNELVVIEWEGLKREWGNDDVVNDSIDYFATVRAWVEYARRRDWEDKANVGTYKGLWDQRYAEYAWLVKKDNRRRDSYAYPAEAVNLNQQNIISGGSNSSSFTGAVGIALGASGGVVTGLAVPFTPRSVRLTVGVPVNGIVMTAVEVLGTLTASGFTYYLSGVTDSSQYVLNYEIS